MNKFRDLFTEKPNEMSAYHEQMLACMMNKVNEGFYEAFYSPVQNVDTDYFNILKIIEKQSIIGKDHILFKNYQKLYANSLSDNIVIPYLDITKQELKDLILICDPEDSERIAKKHIKKMPNFVPLLYDSLISTTDLKHWKEQRMEYVNAFNPIEFLIR